MWTTETLLAADSASCKAIAYRLADQIEKDRHKTRTRATVTKIRKTLGSVRAIEVMTSSKFSE